MRFLFLSDTHFTCKNGVKNPIWLNRLLIYKWDEIKEKVIAEIKRLNPEAIIHCGDFTHFGSREDFAYGKEILDATGIEWYAVPGNHDAFACDVKDEMRKKYDMAAGRGFHYSKLFGRIAVLFLDVCAFADGKHFSIDDSTLIWLESFLIENSDRLVFLVCHIPIKHRNVISNNGTLFDNDGFITGKLFGRHFDDNIGKIKNVDKIKKIIRQNAHIKIVFSGHWHINSLYMSNGVYYKIVPSICEYPCEVVIVDCNDDKIRIYNKALESLNLREDSIIKERNNTWAAGTKEARDTTILF